jgi:hypothetical protein
LGGPYKQNFETKYKEAKALQEQCNNENKTIYYEQPVTGADIPKPEF